MKENEMIAPGDVVLAGVSGGADSMCLLMVLLEYKKQTDFALRVIHVEHGIRGEESAGDAAFVERFCKARDIPCEVVCVDAAGFAKKNRLSLEEAARTLRYAAFEERAARALHAGPARAASADHAGVPQETAGTVRIAVAHHREDQAETVLWQLIRGSDVRGLGGMRPERGRMIRPLLGVRRAEIEDYLNAEGIGWREDTTNASTDYTRNCIRHQVLPVLTKLNTQAAGHICETAERLREVEDFLQGETRSAYARCVCPVPEGGLLLRDALKDEHPLLVRRVVYEALCECLGSAKDIGAEHVRLSAGLFSLPVGRTVHLPYGGRAKRAYDGVRLFAGDAAGRVPGELFAGDAPGRFSPEQVRMEVLTQFNPADFSKKKYTKWFNYDKIKNNAQIRHRLNGDYLVIDGEGHRQKLSRYLINEKIPQEERDHLLLVADGPHVMWVIGHRISDYYKVDKDTKNVLKVQLIGGKEDE